MVAVALASSCVLTLLIGLALAVRLLIIQYLNILIIIIIIWLLALRLETTHGHACQRTVLSLIHSRAWPWRSVDVVVGIGPLAASQVSRWTQSWRLMNECFLVRYVHRVHLHVRVGMHPREIVKMHVVGRSNKELLLLLHAHVLLALPLILLLQLHVAVLILSVRKCVIQALGVIPGLLCILLAAARSLGSRRMWQLEIVFAVLARIHRDRLHVEPTAVHRCVLSTALLIL